MNLNKEQLEAVTSNTNNILVIAGAGTGKTRVLTHRIVHLLEHGVKEKEILAFTFTNKAADEMKSRLKNLLTRYHTIQILTFHSYCYQLLKDYHDCIGLERHFTIIDDNDKTMLIRQIIKENNLEIIDKVAIKAISFAKNHVEQKHELYDQVLINLIFHKYQNRLRQMNKLDLDDLLYYTYLLLRNEYIAESIREDIKHILIDECQDTNHIQMNIIYTLSENASLFLVGDYNQSIYAFRGSNIKNSELFVQLKKPQIIKLTNNYRSSDNIINAANTLIDNNKMQIVNLLKSATEFDKKYQIICAKLINENDEAQYISSLLTLLQSKGYSYEEIAILYRNNSTSHVLEKELLLKKIPYVLYGSYPFFKYAEIKTIISYYRFIYNHHDETGLYYLNSRYYDSKVGRFISPDDVSYLDPESTNGLNLYAYCMDNPVMCISKDSSFGSGGIVSSATLGWNSNGAGLQSGSSPEWLKIGVGAIPDIILGVQYLLAKGIHNKFVYSTTHQYRFPILGDTWRWFSKTESNFATLTGASFKQIVTGNARAGFGAIVKSFGKTTGLTGFINLGFNLLENGFDFTDGDMWMDTAIDTGIGLAAYGLAAGTASLAVAGLAMVGLAIPGGVVVVGIIGLSIFFDWAIREITG